VALAETCNRRGDWDSARRHAQKMAKHFKQRSERNVRDHFARINWAQAVTFLKQFPEAVAILEEGWTATAEPMYKLALGRVYAGWCDYQVKVKGEKPLEQLALVEKGLGHSPNDLDLMNRLMAAVTKGGEDADQARAALRSLLARGQARGIAHFALGVDAWQRGEKEEAGVHWEQANKLAPHLTEVANTLAMHLAEADPPDLPRALQIVNLALERAPNHPNYRDTRGQIYMKMGRWHDALPDLEAASGKSPSPALHRRLATVYEHLGIAGMAATHRQEADLLAAKQKAKN
jgi:tetratricopeptide (TPR) repeat protein